MNEAYLLTGGNIGNRAEFLQQAKNQIENCGQIIRTSSVYETAAWGKEDQQSFLNQVLKIATNLDAPELLDCLLGIESELGRTRTAKFGPRTIDIDILLFNNEVIDLPGLRIPHPQMQNRRFVLVPLNEIAAGIIHPVLRKTIAQILADCPDPLSVNKFS